ncbi:MAG: ribonuclease R [Neisseria sp.]|nr:ribonuclease R [Neisseria sp.]
MTSNKKNTTLRAQDPFLAREQEKYDAPLPSREWIVAVLEQDGVPLSVSALEKKLSVKKSESEAFGYRLSAMVRDGQIYINRRGAVCVADKIELVKCRVEGHKDGYGFAVPLIADGGSDFALNEKQMRTLMHGDIISIRPAGFDRRGRREGRVLEVLERAASELIARAYWEHGMAIAEPEDKRITQTILLPETARDAFENGQVVTVHIETYPVGTRPAVGRIVEVLGNYADAGMEIEIALRKHHLPHQFSSGCLNAAKKIPDTVKPNEHKGREDLRTLPLVTIDGETARDFDDAVYAEKQGNGWRLVVAIADVSHYVKPQDGIDTDARERGTSVYFPRRVIPMLPESLSNGICSLNPNVERLVMACDMQINARGDIGDYRFYPAVMKSHARLTYTEVWENLQSDGHYPLKKELTALYSLFKVLFKKREERGAMDFDSQETQMIFDDNGKIERIIPVIRNDAHRLIEECMLAANVCAADFLEKNQHPALYRAHGSPNLDKLNMLREQLALLGLSLGGGDKPTPRDYAAVFSAIAERPDRHMIQIMLLRSMQQAVYQTANEGHFGLAYDAYTHFTSPIRRYPDLTVHRAIKAVLQGKKYQEKSWDELGVHCSFTERRADDASRDVERWLKTYYMRDKIGEVFTGVVSGMANFGLFVTLDDVYIEGMIHISDLGQDYFHYRPEILAIEGERTRKRFSIGDAITVRVAQADLDTCRVDLTLLESQIPSSAKKSKPSTKGKPSTGTDKKRSAKKAPK